jgi:hypothetical protein
MAIAIGIHRRAAEVAEKIRRKLCVLCVSAVKIQFPIRILLTPLVANEYATS